MALNFPSTQTPHTFGPAKVIILDMGTRGTDEPFTIFSDAEERLFQVRNDNDIHYIEGWFLADFDSIVEV